VWNVALDGCAYSPTNRRFPSLEAALEFYWTENDYSVMEIIALLEALDEKTTSQHLEAP
jgi:hypothetical protein